MIAFAKGLKPTILVGLGGLRVACSQRSNEKFMEKSCFVDGDGRHSLKKISRGGIMNVHLYVDGSLKARPASVEDAKDLARVFFPAACAVVIMRSGRLQPHEQWIYDYDLKDWISRTST